MQSHYSFQCEGYTFDFVTKNGIAYSVSFIEDYSLTSVAPDDEPIENVYQLTIEKKCNSVEPFDLLTFRTVEKIIKDFFTDQNKVVIYLCYDGDEKGESRARIFSRWYDKSPLNSHIHKATFAFTYNDTRVFSSLLYHKNATNSKLVLERYAELGEALSTDK